MSKANDPLVHTDINGWQMDFAHEKLRAFAAQALGRIGDPDIVPQLCDVLRDGSAWLPLRFAAAKALGQIRSDEGVSTLSEVLEQKEMKQSLRHLSAAALARIASPETMHHLKRAAEDSWREVW